MNVGFCGGRVQFKSGKPVTGGLFIFSRKRHDGFGIGAIAADGMFTIINFPGGDRTPGAVPGPHRVIISPLTPQEAAAFPATTLSEPLRVKLGDNEFTLTVDGPG